MSDVAGILDEFSDRSRRAPHRAVPLLAVTSPNKKPGNALVISVLLKGFSHYLFLTISIENVELCIETYGKNLNESKNHYSDMLI